MTKLGALLLGALLMTAASGAEARCNRANVPGAEAQVPAGRINQALLDAAILSEVNYERCRKGLRALKPEPRLTRTAAGHSKWMARAARLSHKGSNTLTQRLKRSGVKFRTGAENIGMVHYYQIDRVVFLTRGSCQFTNQAGQPLPPHSYASLARAAVGNWMNSPKHRANILNRQVKFMGAGAGYNGRAEYCGTVYLTQNFVG
ncbi:CAP domain-containing protein [Aliiroseovarius sp.]|uniref:CAP domain-containing protein n=1 Tax=Aliiroseovarius sp. TaxID=1872442 RepID=UPI003BA8D3C7